MAARTHQRRPTFLWQAALILLPVIVLAVMGGLSLRQDKILAEHDAKERAQQIADDLLPKVWDELTNNAAANTRATFDADASGRLIFPPSYPNVPQPQPLDLTALNAEQLQLWREFQTATEIARRINIGQHFLETTPPETFAGNATYELGMLLIEQKKFSEAAETFDVVAKKYPQSVGETGLPLAPLAQLKLFELQPREKGSDAIVQARGPRPVNSIAVPEFVDTPIKPFGSLDLLCSNLVCQPTPLTPFLLAQISAQIHPMMEIYYDSAQGQRIDPYEVQAALVGTDSPKTAATIRKWRTIWADHELARQFYLLARTNFTSPGDQAVLPQIEFSTEPPSLTNTTFANPTWKKKPAHMFWIDLPHRDLILVPIKPTVEHKDAKALREVWEHRWLVISSEKNPSTRRFVCLAEHDIGKRLTTLVENSKQIPEYSGVGFEVAGEKLTADVPDLRLWSYHLQGGGKSSGHEVRDFNEALATTVLGSALSIMKLEARR